MHEVRAAQFAVDSAGVCRPRQPESRLRTRRGDENGSYICAAGAAWVPKRRNQRSLVGIDGKSV
jgi:hypothetical protein